MSMIGMIPVIVYGGIAKKFSEGMLGTPKQGKGSKKKAKRVRYSPSKYKPF